MIRTVVMGGVDNWEPPRLPQPSHDVSVKQDRMLLCEVELGERRSLH